MKLLRRFTRWLRGQKTFTAGSGVYVVPDGVSHVSIRAEGGAGGVGPGGKGGAGGIAIVRSKEVWQMREELERLHQLASAGIKRGDLTVLYEVNARLKQLLERT